MSYTVSKEKREFNVNLRLHRFGVKFFGNFPRFTRPEPIGFYSLNEAREFQDNADNMSFLFLPHPSAMPLDLNAGIESVQRKSVDPDYHDIHQICHYIYNHQELLTTTPTGHLELNTDFVTLRGILRLIMTMPYERGRDFRLMVTRLNGTIYISKVETAEQQAEREQMTAMQQDMCSWGFKFEQYCTTKHPNTAPVTNEPVIESKEFACIYSCKLSGFRLLYGAEMDCIKSSTYVNLNDPAQLQSAEFVELKTSVRNMTQRQQRTFETYKTLNWWSQSFLVGIDTIIAGLRDNNGLVHEFKEYSVRDLHRNKPWSPAAMGIFLVNFLGELRTVMERINDLNAIVKIDYVPERSKIEYTVLQGANVQPMLPGWYRELMRGTAKS